MMTWIVLAVLAVAAAVVFVLFAILTVRWLAILIESRRHIERSCRGADIRIETKRLSALIAKLAQSIIAP